MRIGLIGAGAVASLHAAAADLLPDLCLTAVCDLVDDAAAAVAEPYGAATFGDHVRLMESGLVDAVIVNTPHGLHREMVEDAAARGLHVLVEKPMATTIEDCDAMIAACDAAGVVLSVGHIQHFMEEKLAVARVLASGELGQVRAVQDVRGTDYRPGTRSAWFFSPQMAGGGALMNIGAHCLDRSVWLGQAPAVSISASTVSRFGVPVETDGFIHLGLANGASVSVSVLSGIQEDKVTVVCERGILVADAVRGALLRVDGQVTTLVERKADAIETAFRRQLADFVTTLEGGAAAVGTEHARHIVELVTTAYRSASDGGRRCALGGTAA